MEHKLVIQTRRNLLSGNKNSTANSKSKSKIFRFP